MGRAQHVVSDHIVISVVSRLTTRTRLIYQLLDYERTFKAGGSPAASDRSSIATDEEEWSRRRQMMEDEENEHDCESIEVMREARALDKAMEDRLLARKSSASSVGSSNGIGMGQAWRNRYSASRKRTGSIASVVTTGSVLSEDLIEVDEESGLLGVGGGFSCSSAEPTEDEESSISSGDPSSRQPSPCSVVDMQPPSLPTARLPPPSAPAHKHTFSLPPIPATATRATFDLPSRVPMKPKARRRPPPLFGTLPPVPSSPVTPHVIPAPTRARTESRKPQTPPAFLLRKTSHSSGKSVSSTVSFSSSSSVPPLSATPSQTLFVFPPSPTSANVTALRTPSTMTLTSNSSFPFPSVSTPRVSTFRMQGGRSRSFIGIGTPVTPTIASSRVDARGWVGIS